MYKELYKVSPPESINYNWFGAGMRFAKGDIGMMYWWTPYFYLVNNNDYMNGKPSVIKGKFKIAALPQQPGKKQVTSIGGWQFSIPTTAACPDQAWKFLKWSTSAETAKKMALVTKYGNQFSDFSRTSLFADKELKTIYPYLDQLLPLLQAGSGKDVRPPMPIYAALEGVYGLQINKILLGANPKKTLVDTNSLFKNLLAGNFLLPYTGKSYDDTYANTQALIKSLTD
jgi:multiple sugar transport system substrate-binding protein